VTSIQNVNGRDKENFFGLGLAKPSRQTPRKTEKKDSPWKETPNFAQAKIAIGKIPD